MGKYLERTIESVIRNMHPGDEYFIIDGGSTDNSVAIIKSYEKYLSGWVSKKDNGYADAISKGFKHTKCDYMCWVNSGDLLLAGSLDEARKQLLSSNADFIYGDDFYIDDSDRVILRSCARNPSLKSMMLYGGWTPLQEACFWKHELYNSVGGIDDRLKYAADYDMFLKMSIVGRCVYVPLVFSAFRKHDGQKSIQGRVAYKHERICCQIAALDRDGCSWVKRQFLTKCYWLMAWLRARVFQKYYQSKLHEGESVQQLTCRSYK
jgi:glycosyltransferase involved in cell wall biosynthesis